MNRLTIEKRAQIIAALVEGNSLRRTVRTTGAAMNTLVKSLADVGSELGVSRQGDAEFKLQADSMRRNLAILLRKR